MKLSTRLTAAMVAVVLLTAIVEALVIYRNLAAAIRPGEYERLQLHARQLATELASFVHGARADVLAIRGTPALQEIVQSSVGAAARIPDRSLEDGLKRLETQFVSTLEAKPEYVQLRLIGTADGGRELVRVDRSGVDEAIRTVTKEELQAKGGRDYFRNTIGMPAGEIYTSPIELNQEHGAVEVPHLPVMRVATPISAPGNQPFGILVINVDMRPILDKLRRHSGVDSHVYLVNSAGDFLLHPDTSREFGFDVGRRVRIQDEFEALSPLLGAETTGGASFHSDAGGTAYAAVSPIWLDDRTKVLLIETVPESVIMAPATIVRRSLVQVAVVATLLAGAVALVFTKSLTKPLGEMTDAVEAFPSDAPMKVPTSAAGEIGVLARAFDHMAREVDEKTNLLRREVEDRRHAETQFRMAVEASPSGMVMVDEAGTILLVNAETERLFGYSRDELIGRPVEMLLPERFREQHPDFRAQFHAEPGRRGMGFGRELFARRKDGSEFMVEVGLNPIDTPDGLNILAAVIDITQRKRAEARHQMYAAKLEQSNTELEQFAYVVSHDLKAPLRGIAAVATWLAEDFADVSNQDTKENLRLMLERINRLNKLIDGILQYSRVGRHEANRVLVDVDTLVEDIVASVAPPPNIEIRIERPLPKVAYDETQLRQVFQNLIDNAIKHLDKPTGQIAISGGRKEDIVRFHVADTGAGIPEHQFERIFRLFQTLKPKDQCHSAGAGLAISKRIVESNGGSIHVFSELGRGTEFVFSVPAETTPALDTMEATSST